MNRGYLQLLQIYGWLSTDHEQTEKKFSVATSTSTQHNLISISKLQKTTSIKKKYADGIPISSQSHYYGSARLSTEPKNQVSGKSKTHIFTHPNSSHKRDRSLCTRFSQARDKNSDTSNPSKLSCVAFKNPLQTIHTTNPIPQLTCTTQLHGKDPRSQLPKVFFTNTSTRGSDHQHIFHRPTSLWAVKRNNAKSRNRIG